MGRLAETLWTHGMFSVVSWWSCRGLAKSERALRRELLGEVSGIHRTQSGVGERGAGLKQKMLEGLLYWVNKEKVSCILALDSLWGAISVHP